MRAWEQRNPINRNKLSADSVTFELVTRQLESNFKVEDVSFEQHPDANPPSRIAGLKRFQVKAKTNVLMIF